MASPVCSRGWSCAIFACKVILRVKTTGCPRDGTPVLESSCAAPPQSQLGYFLFGSVARLAGIQNGHEQLGLE